MKLIILLITLFSLQAFADVSAQKINLSVRSRSFIDVLELMQQQNSFDYSCNEHVLKKANSVSLDLKNVSLEHAINKLFENQPFRYKLKDNILIIQEKEVNGRQNSDVLASQNKFSGRVVNKNNKALFPVTITNLKTGTSTSTHKDGTFSLIANIGDRVSVSYLGYLPKQVVVSQLANLEIVLEEDHTAIEEVTVNTGYQTINKLRMTGSVEQVTLKDIENKGFTNIEEALKGTMPGVATMNLSGRPGAQAQIRIRGINSLTGNSDPIWIVDGMPLQGDLPKLSMGGTEFQETVLTSGIGNLSPDDIESITVLKDAAATAIYGARAANGVIVVKTKRGTAGKSYINVQSSVGINEAPRNRLVMMNTNEKIAFERGIYTDFPGLNLGGRVYQLLKKADNGLMTRQESEAEIERLRGINTNWFNEVFRVGKIQSHNVALSGGNESTQFYAGISYQSQQGVMPNNRYNNTGGNLKLTHDFDARLRINFDIRYSLRDDRSSSSVVNPLEYATYANTYERPYDEYGNYDYDRSSYSALSTIYDGYKYDFNILKDMNENTSNSKYHSSQATLKLEYKLFEGLMLSSMGTFSSSNNHVMAEFLPNSFSSKYQSWLTNFYAEGEVPEYLNRGKLSETTSRQQGWNIRNQLEFARGLGDKHYVSFYLGQEVSSQKGFGFSSMIPEWDPLYGVATYPDLINSTITSKLNINSLGAHSETQDRSVSFFGIGSYSYEDRYVLSASARMDGVDIIGTANRFSPLWNISGKWNLHKEKLFNSFTFFNQLAIRGSYGFTGSIDRNILPFSRMAKVDNKVYDGESILDRYYPASPPVQWQRKEDRNIGLDASFLNNRFNLTANYYVNDTRNLIDSKTLASSTGLTSVAGNVASLRNKGWELSLKTVNIQHKDFSWITAFNITKNSNVVTETFYKQLKDFTVNINSTFEDSYSMYIQGQSVKSFYGYRFAGVDPYTGGTLAYVNGVDKNGIPLGSLNDEGKYVYNMDLGENYTSEMLHASREYLGESYPPITGGFSTQFNYKRFSFSTQFTFMTGHLARSFLSYSSGTAGNSARNVLSGEANRWRKPGDMTDVPKYQNGRSEYLYQVFDFRFEKGDYLKCNNMSLGYNLSPELSSKLHLKRARFNFNVNNVFTLTKFRGIDPETMGAFGYPSSRRYNVTISLGI